MIFYLRLGGLLIVREQILKIDRAKNSSIGHYLYIGLFYLDYFDRSDRGFSEGLGVLPWEKVEKFQIVKFCLKRDLVCFVGLEQFLLNL